MLNISKIRIFLYKYLSLKHLYNVKQINRHYTNDHLIFNNVSILMRY